MAHQEAKSAVEAGRDVTAPSSWVLGLPGGCERLALRPGGDLLALACNDGHIAILDAVTLEVLDREATNEGVGYAVAWHPSGDRLLAVGADGRVALVVWDHAARTATRVDRIEIDGATLLWDVVWASHEVGARDAWVVGYGLITQITLREDHRLAVVRTYSVAGDCYSAAVRAGLGDDRRMLTVGSDQWKVERRRAVPSPLAIEVDGAQVVLRFVAADPESGAVAAVGAVGADSHLFIWRQGQESRTTPSTSCWRRPRGSATSDPTTIGRSHRSLPSRGGPPRSSPWTERAGTTCEPVSRAVRPPTASASSDARGSAPRWPTAPSRCTTSARRGSRPPGHRQRRRRVRVGLGQLATLRSGRAGGLRLRDLRRGRRGGGGRRGGRRSDGDRPSPLGLGGRPPVDR